ncbi:uncharacterized protein At2g39795, mitochondrial isoform X1 [Pistacia vera]|uniref:uncharacterized protein At2g39795, mitochondrial isoform X1 n=1 Tax=Pistacia vera TaxID=55513 RepID=UPI001262FCE1|nr:uncharacterized protein At2g39795, mitochondrial isoform X1 [Pistacia vera]
MARFFIQSARKTLLSSSTVSKTLIHGLQRHHGTPSIQSRNAPSTFLFQSRYYATDLITKSPFEANILRILRNEIDYQSEYAPPHQPATKFNSFTVEDRAGEQWVIMNRKSGDNEDIKIEVTMFDGLVSVPKVGDDSTGEDVRLHISVIVDISKADGSDFLEFVCSAWPDALEIHKVYVLSRDNKLARPYMGPHFRNLSGELRKTLREYLEARGVNDELSVFLHEYMMNKDRIELIRWLGNVKSFVEK